MPIKYLLCPACGGHRFYVHNAAGEEIYFHVDPDCKPFPTEVSHAELSELDFSEIACTGCSWTGPIRKLVRIFCG
jgi:hypothetical protein